MKNINKIKLNLLKILILFFIIIGILYISSYLLIFNNNISIFKYLIIGIYYLIINVIIIFIFTFNILLCFKNIKNSPEKNCDTIYKLCNNIPFVILITGIIIPFLFIPIINNLINITFNLCFSIALIFVFSTTVFYIFSQIYFKNIIKYTEFNYRPNTTSIVNLNKKIISKIPLSINLIFEIVPLIFSTTFLALIYNFSAITDIILFIALLLISTLCVVNIAINLYINIKKINKKNINYSDFTNNEIGNLIFEINATKKIYNDYIQQIENTKNNEIEKERLASIEILRRTVDAKDTYTRGHSDRVSLYSVLIGKKLGLSDNEIQLLKIGGLFHDIGKIGIPDNILLKTSKLTDEEYTEIKKHPTIGAHILENSSVFKDIIPIVLYHHEKYDGYGYPNKIKGEEIPLLARIVAVADTFDAMTSKRSYRDALSIDIVKQEFIKCSGTQFDPYIAKIFLDILEYNYKDIEYIIKNN